MQVCESDDNELMDAVPLELQIQICVGQATGTPMLGGDNLAWRRLELGTDLATARAVFEALVDPRCFLNGRNVLPSLVIARTVSMMQCIADPKLRLARGNQEPAAYEERSHLLLQQPECGPISSSMAPCA
jgi:hypothetical protein